MDMGEVALVAGTRCRLMPEPQDLELDPEVFTGIQIVVELSREGEDLMLTLEASADAHLLCDRTLDPFTVRVSGCCRILLQEGGNPACREPFDETISVVPQQQVIDVAPLARDTLVLAVPARKVAPHAVGIELPRVFGAPAPAIAPHLAPLLPQQTDY